MSMKKCPKCGELFADSYHSCPYCAEEEELRGGRTPRPMVDDEAPRPRRSFVLPLAIVAAVLVVGGVLWYVIGGRSAPVKKPAAPVAPVAQEETQQPAAQAGGQSAQQAAPEEAAESEKLTMRVGESRTLAVSGGEATVTGKVGDATITVLVRVN